MLSSRWIICTVLLLATMSAHATRYVYDDASRVVGVVNQAGQAARYQYDAVGNLIAVASPTADALVFALQPDHGPPGTQVRIYGNALPNTPGQQVVFSAATPAATAASSAQEIQFTVPAVATGVHALTLDASGSTLALGDFEVTTGLAPPTIASVSHVCAKYDAVVSVTGSGFDVRPDATRVEVGGRLARITSITETTLSFRAPLHTPGGPVRVVTEAGSALSNAALYLVPSAGDPCVALTAGVQMQIDGAVGNAQLTATKPVSRFAFHAERGQWITIHFASPEVTSSSYNPLVRAWVLGPENRTLAMVNSFGTPVESLQLSGTLMSAHLMPVERTGIHVLDLTLTGSTARSFDVRIDTSPTVSKNSVTAWQAQPGQSLRMIYSAQVGDELGIGLKAQNSTSDVMSSSLNVFAQDHSAVTPEPVSQPYCSETATCALNIKAFAAAGAYPLIWRPSSWASAAQATLWVNDDARGQLTAGAPQQIAITKPGENARFPIQAVAGDSFSINVRDLTMASAYDSINVVLYAPNGATVPLKVSSQGGTIPVYKPGAMLSAFLVPFTGVYSVMLDPTNGILAGGQIELDPGTPLIVGDTPLAITATGSGIAKRFTVDGAVGQKLGIGLKNILLTASDISETLKIDVYLPSGELYGPQATCNRQSASFFGCEIDLGPLPFAGKYALIVRGSSGVSAASYDILATNDVELLLDDSPEPVQIVRNGGNARLYFSASPGAAQTVHIATQVANPAGASVSYTVLRPDGFPLIAPLYVPGTLTGSASGTIRIGDFPLAGTYTVFVDPAYAAIAQFSASVTPGVLDNSQIPQLLNVVPGPWYASTFTAGAGSHPSVGVSIQSLANRNDNYMKIEVVDPLDRRLIDYNTTQAYASCYTINQNYCDFDLFNASEPGVYQVVVWPGTPTRQDAQITVATVNDMELSGLDGTFSLTNPGQNARLNFTAVTGNRFNLVLTRLTSSYPASMVSFHLLDAAGYRIGGGSMTESASTYTVSLPTIPYSGDFSIVLDTSFGTPASLRAQLIAL